MIEKKIIETEEAFGQLRNDWNQLLTQSRADTIFLTWEWLFHWWRHYRDQTKCLFIIVIYEDSHLIGIAPLLKSIQKAFGILKISQLEFLGTGQVSSDYLDFICLPGKEGLIIEEVFNIIEHNTKTWDVISLTDIPQQSLTIEHLTALAEQRGYQNDKEVGTICPYISLPPLWETYLQSLQKSNRKEVRQDRRRLENEGKIETYRTQEKSALQRDLDIFMDMHSRQWKGKIYRDTANFLNRQFREFNRNVTEVFLEKGYLYLFFLKVNEKVAAAQYGFLYNNKLFFYLPAKDSAWDTFSVGVVLQSYCIEDAINKGIGEIDLLRGEEQYKHKWTPLKRKNMRVQLWKKRTKVGFFWKCQTCLTFFKGIIKFLLPKTVKIRVREKLSE